MKLWINFDPKKLIHNQVRTIILKDVCESIEFWQGWDNNSMKERIVFSTNDTNTTGYLWAKE
jgi:pyridoxine/pyridoxamine 5'-phosphate oxidase